MIRFYFHAFDGFGHERVVKGQHLLVLGFITVTLINK